MQLKLDPGISYAIALEGGGAKGAYEVGVWQALREAGIRFCAVSGTSVGALNGAMMVMGDLEKAVSVWRDIRLSNVINLDGMDEDEFRRIIGLNFELFQLHEVLPKVIDIIRAGGLDVAPLRSWVREVVDAGAIRASDIPLFICTVSLSDRRGLEVKVNDLPEDEIYDMLLASAYHPTFRQAPLGGKYYTDGGMIDSLPLHVLVENGYKEILAVRIPGHGVERRFKLPEDVHVTYISTRSDLGSVLNFSPEQSRRDMEIGYLDAQRVLYGLAGNKYYVNRTMRDRDALDLLLRRAPAGETLRRYCEVLLPGMAKRLGVPEGDYFELWLALTEEMARAKGLDTKRIYTDWELQKAVESLTVQ